MLLSAEQIDRAWSEMGATVAGRNARQKLVGIVTSLCPNASDMSALLLFEGQRILALQLLKLMDAEDTYVRASADPEYGSGKRKPVATGSGYKSKPGGRRVPPSSG